MQSYSPPKLDPKKQAAVDSGEFDFLLPYEKNLYRPDEAAAALGREDLRFVYALVDEGRLEAHVEEFDSRKIRRITRRSVLLYLAETANYEPGMLVIRIEALMKKLKAPQLHRLLTTTNKLLNQIS